MKDRLQEGQCAILLALADHDSHPRRAAQYRRRAERLFRRIEASFELHRILLLRLAVGDLPEEKRPGVLQELLGGAARLEHDFLFSTLEPERVGSVLAEAYRLGIELDYSGRRLSDLGARGVPHLVPLLADTSKDVRVRVIDLLAQIGGEEARTALTRVADSTSRSGRTAREAAAELEHSSGVPLQIQALGSLKVTAGRHRLTYGRWRSLRALRLFQLLLVNRFRWIPRDVIMEILWPEADLDKAVNSLRQTIRVLRRILEPDLKETSHSRYIRFRNEACWLEPGEGYSYDVEEFEGALEKAEKIWSAGKRRPAEPHLRKAEALYRGDLLAENPYEDFIAPQRESFRDHLIWGLGRLLELHARASSWKDVIPLCRRLLKLDPYREEAYWHLIQSYVHLGNRREVLAGYHQYEEMMVREMGLLPSSRMRALADKVVKPGGSQGKRTSQR